MKHEIPIRISIIEPIPGVAMQVQRGRDELLPPSEISGDVMNFDFPITVDLSFGSLNFLGQYSQGPKDARFIYVNSGTLAGQADSCWTRRAKISLISVTTEQVSEVLASPGARLETSFFGRGGDGGPICAGVKGIVWQVGKK